MDELSPYLERVVLVANRKGGVLKSSITRSVAGEVAKAHRVLVLDGDPQGNLSKVYFGLRDVEPGGWESDRGRSLAMALQYGTDLQPLSAHGVDVVCGGPELMGALGAAIVNPNVDLAANLRGALARLCSEQRYDLVVIDSGPGDTNLLDAYMWTARWLVVPVVDGDDNGLDGLDKIGSRWVELHRQGADLEVLGAVVTLVDPRATARNQRWADEVAAALGPASGPFQAMIRDTKAARSDTSRYGLSAGEVADKAKDVRKLRISALRKRAAAKAAEKAANGDQPGKHKASDDQPIGRPPERAPDRIENPDEPWETRKGEGLADDYRDLSKEILTRIRDRLGATVG